jgi:RNA recognition motif-containing protein
MAKVWVGNVAPEVTDDELRTFLEKYGFPEPGQITRVGSEGPRPAASVEFPGKTTGELAEFARRIHDVFWRGHRLHVQVV